MSKIVVEDRTNTTEQIFEEEVVRNYAFEAVSLIGNDAVAIGLSPRETVYAIFLMAESMLAYAIGTNNGTAEDYSDVSDWAKRESDAWITKVKEAGIFDKVKEMAEEMNKKRDKESA